MAQWVGELAIPRAARAAGVRRPVVFWLVAVVLCLLPLEWWLLPYNLEVADFGLVLLTAVGGLTLLYRRQPVRLPLLIPFWILLFASLIATLTGLNFAVSALAIFQEVYLYVWFVVLANLLVHLSEKHFQSLLRLWSLIALVVAATTLLGMLQIGPDMFHSSPDGSLVYTGSPLGRGIGTFANPNAAATYLFISFFVLLAARWPIWLTALAAGWLLFGMVATGSLGALLATAVGLAGLGLIAIPSRNRPPVIVLALLAAVVLAILLLSAWPAWASGGLPSTESGLFHISLGRLPRSLMSRFGLIERVWPIYLQYPFGIGPNASAGYLGSLHNDYIAILFERGPLGLIGWLWLVGAVLALPLRTVRRLPERTHTLAILALGAGFLAVALNAFTHELSHFRQLWMLLAFLYAACWKSKGSS